MAMHAEYFRRPASTRRLRAPRARSRPDTPPAGLSAHRHVGPVRPAAARAPDALASTGRRRATDIACRAETARPAGRTARRRCHAAVLARARERWPPPTCDRLALG